MAAYPARANSAINAIIAHSGNVGTAVTPIANWNEVFPASVHVPTLGSVTVTVIVATPERPSAPRMVSVRAPPAPLVITIALAGTSVVSELVAVTTRASVMIDPPMVKSTDTDPLTGMT